MAAHITIKQINKALEKKFGEGIQLFKGKGYFYFSGTLCEQMRQQGIYTNSLNGYSVDEIVRIAEKRLSD